MATAAIAQALTEAGIAVDVLTARAGGWRRRGVAGQGEVTAEVPAECGGRLRIMRVPSLRRGIHEAGIIAALTYVLFASPRLHHLLRRQRYDAVHLFFSLPTGLLLSQVRRVGTPSVVSLRGSDVPGYDTSNPQLQRIHKAMLPVTRWIWRHAGHVVALSDSLGRLARATDPNLRYSVIHNGVDTQLFRPSERSSPPQNLTCISVARFVDRKGLPDLLRAMQEPALRLGAMRLEIVGSGTQEGDLRKLTSSLGIAERVTFLGSLDRESVAERLRRADIFVLAPSSEAFGNAFAEALASGLPIVGTKVGGIPEFIEDGVNGLLVPSGDPQRLAGALQTLASDPQRRLDMGSRNREKALTQLSWDRVAACYMDVYQQLVEKKDDDSHRD